MDAPELTIFEVQMQIDLKATFPPDMLAQPPRREHQEDLESRQLLLPPTHREQSGPHYDKPKLDWSALF